MAVKIKRIDVSSFECIMDSDFVNCYGISKEQMVEIVDMTRLTLPGVLSVAHGLISEAQSILKSPVDNDLSKEISRHYMNQSKYLLSLMTETIIENHI